MAEDLPYEITGTATVTAGQSAVVGQGTRWTRCRPGDTFFGRAGERNIVVSITDDTHLALLFPATVAQAAQGVAVMRTPDDVFTQTLARSVFRKLDDSTLLALAGLPATARSGFRFDANSIAEKFPFTDKAKTLLGIDLADNVMSLLGQVDYAAIRNVLSVAPKQTATNDTTAGAGVIVGGFGWGGDGMAVPTNDLNKAIVAGVYFTPGSSTANGPGGNGVYGPVLVLRRGSQNIIQIALWGEAGSLTEMYVRGSGNNGATWTGWRSMHVEGGSNANGRYIRYNDGTQICYATGLPVPTASAGAAAVFGGNGTYTWTFPAAFIATPAVSGGVESGLSASGWLGCGASNNQGALLYHWSYIQRAAGNWTCGAMAVGRWF